MATAPRDASTAAVPFEPTELLPESAVRGGPAGAFPRAAAGGPHEAVVTRWTHKPNVPLPSQFLLYHDPKWLRCFLGAGNVAFAAGRTAAFVFSACMLLVFAPLIGLYAAGWTVGTAIASVFLSRFGRLVSDELGGWLCGLHVVRSPAALPRMK